MAKKPVVNVSMQSLNALFGVLEQQPQSTLWIRSSDLQRQLYVNQNYETIWQRSVSELYQNPDCLIDTLYPIDRDAVHQQLINKSEHHLESDNQFYYRIITPDGKVKFIKDWHYLLTDDGGNLLGIAGLAQEISQSQWQQQSQSILQRYSPDPQALLHQHVFDILRNELHIRTQGVTGSGASETKPKFIVLDNNKSAVNLSRRETEVITHLRAGLSAKQTADKMHVSTRTVEFHLNNIKDKVGCRTKLELLSRIQA